MSEFVSGHLCLSKDVKPPLESFNGDTDGAIKKPSPLRGDSNGDWISRCSKFSSLAKLTFVQCRCFEGNTKGDMEIDDILEKTRWQKKMTGSARKRTLKRSLAQVNWQRKKSPCGWETCCRIVGRWDCLFFRQGKCSHMKLQPTVRRICFFEIMITDWFAVSWIKIRPDFKNH